MSRPPAAVRHRRPSGDIVADGRVLLDRCFYGCHSSVSFRRGSDHVAPGGGLQERSLDRLPDGDDHRGGGTMIYLDHAATAHPRHPGVADAMRDALELAGNAGRGSHGGARAAGAIVASCRERISHLLGVTDPQRISLFPSSTLALSTIIADLCSGTDDDAVMWIGALEHNAVWRPAVRALGEDRVRLLPVDEGGQVDLARLEQLDPGAGIAVVLQHASNVTGLIQPIEEVGA
ncbi:MAG TPA: aminotransferase class V-fold PLP-dependent enzyme, partial [Planctomycetes bacterium]|nr:aminotransferase class V-fold PLP-dependent enzyme [Planctomycetota bacterium]